MCLYPKLIQNRKYMPNKKNKGDPPLCGDQRTKAVPVACGNCIECRKAKKREWQIRLTEEQREKQNGKFVTLTFSDEAIEELTKYKETDEANEIASIAVRRFTERWRKITKKAPRHWLITELGHTGSERIHLHGIIFEDKDTEFIEKTWKYGHIWVGYTNQKTINYIVKYVTKIDEDHKNYKAKIYASNGLGKGYINNKRKTEHQYTEGNTNENYRLPNGANVAMPIYYRNKIFTEEQREKLWIEKLDKGIRYVGGEKIDTRTKEGMREYLRALKYQQKINKRLGYGDDTMEWSEKKYQASRKEFSI